MEQSDGRAMTGTLLLLTGAVLGAGVALLLAPQSGRQTRNDLARQARKTRRRIEGVAGDFADGVSGLVDAIEQKAEVLLEQGKELAQESRHAVLDAVEEGQERLARQRERLGRLLG